MAENSTETRFSEAVLHAIELYQNDQDMRHRADAIRKLIEYGVDSNLPLEDAASPHLKRVSVSVSNQLHIAIGKIRKNLDRPSRDRSFELAYRLVIIRGLKVVGFPPVENPTDQA